MNTGELSNINLSKDSPLFKLENKETIQTVLNQPLYIQRELNNRKFFNFFVWSWPILSSDTLILNWHMEYLCEELQILAERVSRGEKKVYDLVINIPPGTSKTSIVMKAFPVWCWTKWHWMKFISCSYSETLSLESGEASRDLIRSDEFRVMYPELEIKADKDVKSNYRVVKKLSNSIKGKVPKIENGGNRYSTSVGGTVTGFHAHIILIDDPLNPNVANSEKQLKSTTYWMDHVISTRKVDKEITPTVLIMQRIHQKDPSGHLLGKKKANVKHICLPGELNEYEDKVSPSELKERYENGLLDPYRLNREVLNELKQDLGQYGYAGQIGQSPSPPGGGMFRVDNFQIIHHPPMEHEIESTIRFWDKAGTKDGGAYTAGVKISKLKNGKFLIWDVQRGQWSTDDRERRIRNIAEADGVNVRVGIEQEPGSGGKESAEATIRNLAGFSVEKDLPHGDKVFRADPFSVQVNNGNVMMMMGEWNHDYIEEFRFFPFGTYKDQVDASSAGFAKLTSKKTVRSW